MRTFTTRRAGIGPWWGTGVVFLMLVSCSRSGSKETTPEVSSESAKEEVEELHPEPFLWGRQDSVGIVDLHLRMLARRFLKYDSASGRPAGSVEVLMRSAFAPEKRDLFDVWGTPVRILLFADSVMVASAGPTRRWQDSSGITVTAFYGRKDSTTMRSRAAVMTEGRTVWQEW